MTINLITTRFLPAFAILFIGAVQITTVQAQTSETHIAEIRVGLPEFDERTIKIPISKQNANENSIALNFEILFEEPEFLK